MLDPVIQDKRRWWKREDLLFLILFAAVLFLPGLAQTPLFDDDEPRFATAARTMSENHNYLVPFFNGVIRPDKPPLLYWLMNAVHFFTGTWNELTVRLPSAICSTLTLIVLYFMVGSRFGRITGLMAALIFGSCGVFIVESRLATADATMLLFIVICMACAWQAWDAGSPAPADSGKSRRLPRTDYLLDRSTADKPVIVLDHLPETAPRPMSAGLALAFWISLAAGTLTKGVPLIFVLVPMVVLSIATGALATQLREWRSHLHVTRLRITSAFTVAILAAAIVLATFRVHGPGELRWVVSVLGILIILMLLTPGLPGVFARCITRGNWAWWKHLRPAWGVPLLLVLVAAWVIPAGMQSPELLKQMVGIHFLQRVFGPILPYLHIHIADAAGYGSKSAMNSYAEPSGFHTLFIWVIFWPWSVLLIPAAYFTVRRLRGRSAITIDPRPYQFLVAWIVPMWILLELSRGKLLHYPLPTYVAIAILCADALVQSWHRLTDVFAPKWFAVARWVVLAIWCGLGIIFLIAGQKYFPPELSWCCALVAAAMFAAGVAGAIAWNDPSWPQVTAWSWGIALLFANTTIIPNLADVQTGKFAGERMAEIQMREPDFHLAACGFDKPTLVFYSRSHVQIIDSDDDHSRLENLLAAIPFAPQRTPTADSKYLLVVDGPTLSALNDKQLQYFPLRRYTRTNPFTHLSTTVTLLSNILPREDVIAATAPATHSDTQSATAPAP